MVELISLLHFREGCDVAVRRDLAAAIRDTLPQGRLVAPVLAGGRNAGDLLVRARIDAPLPADFGLGARFAAAIASADGALFERAAGSGEAEAWPVYRAALFHAARDPTPTRLAWFVADTVAMAEQMPFIRGWALGKVIAAWGQFDWDVVWEQGYDRVDDLTGRYMMHPAHWGHVDRWFDPEHPDWLIDPGLCHAFCRTDGAA
ncbi:MAG: Dabb family protein [Sphingomonas bacterium]|nr:Dabb family protein [Sphingomonas bacterium]